VQAGSQVGSQPNTQSNEPPRERWDSILQNAREKARQEANTQWEQRFQPYQDFERDPWSAIETWLGNAEKHSLYRDKVKEWVGKRGQPAPVPQEPAPDVPIVDGNGNITGKTYSAERLKEWQRWNEAQFQAKFEERFSPLEQRERERQEQAREQQLWDRATSNAKETLTELRQLPYFKEHEAAVKQALMDNPKWGSNVHQAFNHVMMTQILPTLSQAEQRSAIQQLQNAGAASTVAPNSTTVGTPKFKSFGTAAQYYAEHPEEAAAMAGRR
jgi:hypothetical protein